MNNQTIAWTRQAKIALEAIPAHYKVIQSIVCSSPHQGDIYLMLCFLHEGCDCCFQVRAHEVTTADFPFPGREKIDSLNYMTVEIPGRTLFIEEFEDPKAKENCQQRFATLLSTLPNPESEDYKKAYIARRGKEAWERRCQLWL